MAESTLSITRTDLKRYLARYLGGNRTFSSNSTDQQNDILDCIKSGERAFYNPIGHTWSFLTPLMTLTLTAPYATGTVEVASGVATLSNGTFPSWAADGLFVVDGNRYEVDSRDGNTQITLEDTSVTVSAGATYELQRLQYTLADDFGAFTDPYLSYRREDNKCYSVRLTGPGEILRIRQMDRVNWSHQVLEAAVTPKSGPPDATGHRFALMVWPPASTAGTISGQYYSNPNAIGNDSFYPLGGQPHAETLIESCLAAAERLMHDESGVHQAAFQERLAASIALDQRHSAPKHLGSMNESAWHKGGHMERNPAEYVSYNGTFYLGAD